MIGIIKQLDGKMIKIENKQLLDFVIEKRYFNFINCLLESGCDNWAEKLDKDGKTPLHYAIEHEDFESVEELLKNIDDIHERHILKHGSFIKPDYAKSKLVKFINIPDKSGKIALNYAIQREAFDLAFELLLKGSDIESLSNEDVDRLVDRMVQFRYNDSILKVYGTEDHKYRPIQEKLLRRAPAIFQKLDEGDRARTLQYFLVHGRVGVIKDLLSTIDDSKEIKEILNNTIGNCTPLDRVNYSEHISDDERLEITKYLFEENECTSAHDYPQWRTSLTRILEAAAEHGHIKTFEYFIANEERKNFSDHLCKAVDYNQRNIIDYFLNIIDYIDCENNTILHHFCGSSAVAYLKTMKYLIDKGQDINAPNKKKETPLFMAIFSKSGFNIIKYLVDKGAEVNQKTEDNRTPVSCAIFNLEYDKDYVTSNNLKIINYLLEKGAIISEKDSQPMKDRFAFFKGSYKNNLKNTEWVNYFVHIKKPLLFKDQNDIVKFKSMIDDKLESENDFIRNTPMHKAAENDKIEDIKSSLKNGNGFNAENTKFQTPLDLARDQSQSKELLMQISKLFEDIESDNPYVDIKNLKFIQKEYKLDFYIFNIRNNRKETLLQNAVRLNELSIVEKLLENGSTIYLKELEYSDDFKIKNKDSVELVLKIKEMFDDVCKIEKLLETVNKRIIINVRDCDGQTLLHRAAKSEYEHIINLLKELGADENIMDKNGKKYSNYLG